MKISRRRTTFSYLAASVLLGGAAFVATRGGAWAQALTQEDAPPQDTSSRNAEPRVLAAKVEELGPMAAQATVKLGPVARLPDGSFLQILFAFPGVKTQVAKTPFDIVAVNLQSGRVTRTPSSDLTNDLANDVWTWTWGPDGKLYIGTGGVPHLIRYDPVTAQAKDFGHLWKDNPAVVVLYSLVVGTDGALYGGGVNDTNVMRFDPQTERLDEYGPQGLPRSSYPAFAYSVGGDARFIYTASGKQPWYVVALDRQSGAQRNLMTLPKAALPTILQGRNNVYLRVAQDGKIANYELSNGEVRPIDAIPRALNNYDPVPPGQQPKVALDTRSLSGQRKARLLYADGGAVKDFAFAANTQPYKIQRLTTLPDGRIFGATFPYGDHFFFDPKSGKSSIAGFSNISVYSQLPVGNLVYISGYPNTPLLVFDPSKPWTLQKQGASFEALPADDAVTTNPHRVAYFNQQNIYTHYGLFLAAGADGKIYVGAHAERVRNGGGLGIYDPQSGKVSGLGEETFANYDVDGLASAGRFIVYSSYLVRNVSRPDAVLDNAKMFVFDTTTGRIANSYTPLEKALSTGPIVADGDGVVGLATLWSKRQVLYRMEAESGEVSYRRDVKNELSVAFKGGPDGYIWTSEKTPASTRLVKIAPRTGTIIPVATLPFTPKDFTFSGRDLYLSSGNKLYRVRDVLGIATSTTSARRILR